jgi:TonB family protein
MRSVKFLIALFMQVILLASCGPSEYLPNFEKVELLKLDSLIIPEYRPKYYSSFCRVLFVKAYRTDVKSLETINKEDITIEARIVGGKDAIISLLGFPELAKRARIEGHVVAYFNVDKFGSVSEIKIMKGLGGGVDEEVVDCLKKIKFAPAKTNKENVSCKMRIRIHFWPPEGEEDLLDRKEAVKLKSRKL